MGWTRRRLMTLAALAPLGAGGSRAADADAPGTADVAVESALLQGYADGLLGGLRLTGNAPAHVVAIAHGDALGLAAGGRRAVDRTETVTLLDRWHLGSVTKTFTAALVAKLHEQGRLDREATVRDVMSGVMSGGPGLGPGIAVHEGWGEVTFRDVLTHRTGLPLLPSTLLSLSTYLGPGEDLALPDARRVLLARYLRARPPTRPVRGEYSNLGYVLAGAMTEAAVGVAWERLLLDEVLRPLGLRSGGFGPPLMPDGPGSQAVGHFATASGGFASALAEPWYDVPAAYNPAGRLHLRPRDAVRWTRLHAERDPAFLSEESWRWLHVPDKGQTWACGWMRHDSGLRWMRGSNWMWYAMAVIDPRDGRALFVAGNSDRVHDLDTLGPILGRVGFGIK